MYCFINEKLGVCVTPHGELKGLKKKDLEKLGFKRLTSNCGERVAIYAKYNTKSMKTDFIEVTKRYRDIIDNLLEQGYELVKDFDSKVINPKFRMKGGVVNE
jgi:uridine kinase